MLRAGVIRQEKVFLECVIACFIWVAGAWHAACRQQTCWNKSLYASTMT